MQSAGMHGLGAQGATPPLGQYGHVPGAGAGAAAAPQEQTLFEVLGVGRDADDRALKQAYKAAALLHHPDKGGDAEMFKKVNEAYDVLSDEEQRERYIAMLNARGAHETWIQQWRTAAESSGVARASSKYERTCRNWAKGKCHRADCLYRHYRTAESDKLKSFKICHDFRKGYCRFGGECSFRHPGMDDCGPAQIQHWTCNDPWRSCKTQNHILLDPKRCSACGARRKLARSRYPIGTTVQLTADHARITDEVTRRALLFCRDGIFKKQMARIIQKMHLVPMHGQMVPQVAKFYPSANCYLCVFQDGNTLLVPDTMLRRGAEKWTCGQCKYQNDQRSRVCTLCDGKNPSPVENWEPFLGTWKSLTGSYFITVEEHEVSSSDHSHYYTGVRLANGVLSYQVTLVDDDEDDDADVSSEEQQDPEALGEVRLRLDGRNKLRGEMHLSDGSVQTARFLKIELGQGVSDDEVTSSTFDSRESTPDRERRLAARRAVGQSDGRRRKEGGTPPVKRRRDQERDRDRGRDRDRDRDRRK
eukprot:TRINITY_DN49934_c0_g1_i1.p1 TRINITY_DN49934_c0_g1~~TRINITY_DN49934_c0_g1_i1.p1  ORF type:complete len:561 (+),score=198.37 TRINITY_DN49934_c0_g1_i1:92-1684(+)